MTSTCFRKFVHNSYLRIISICKRIQNKAKYNFLVVVPCLLNFNAASLELVLTGSCVSIQCLCVCGWSLSQEDFFCCLLIFLIETSPLSLYWNQNNKKNRSTVQELIRDAMQYGLKSCRSNSVSLC